MLKQEYHTNTRLENPEPIKLDSRTASHQTTGASLLTDKHTYFKSLHSLEPAILTRWIQLLNNWAGEQGLPRNLFKASYLHAILHNVFRFMGDSEAIESYHLVAKDTRMPEAIDCMLHEPACIALYHTCVRACKSVIQQSPFLKLKGKLLNGGEMEIRFEAAIRTAIHLEIEKCHCRCTTAKCPLPHNNTL